MADQQGYRTPRMPLAVHISAKPGDPSLLPIKCLVRILLQKRYRQVIDYRLERRSLLQIPSSGCVAVSSILGIRRPLSRRRTALVWMTCWEREQSGWRVTIRLCICIWSIFSQTRLAEGLGTAVFRAEAVLGVFDMLILAVEKYRCGRMCDTNLILSQPVVAGYMYCRRTSYICRCMLSYGQLSVLEYGQTRSQYSVERGES